MVQEEHWDVGYDNPDDTVVSCACVLAGLFVVVRPGMVIAMEHVEHPSEVSHGLCGEGDDGWGTDWN
jgi:hypothetical protein